MKSFTALTTEGSEQEIRFQFAWAQLLEHLQPLGVRGVVLVVAVPDEGMSVKGFTTVLSVGVHEPILTKPQMVRLASSQATKWLLRNSPLPTNFFLRQVWRLLRWLDARGVIGA